MWQTDRLWKTVCWKEGGDIANWQEMSSACYHTSQDHSLESDELSLMQMQFWDQHAPDNEGEQKYVQILEMDSTIQFTQIYMYVC